ncbi:MAG: acyl-CoA thioesterase [Devosia sp.]
MTTVALTTFVGVAHPWMCDTNGHVNTRYYMAMFDDASCQLLAHVAGDGGAGPPLGWADVRIEIDYFAEVAAGAVLTITSQIERIGETSLAAIHSMRGTGEDQLRSRARIVTVRFNLDRRKSTKLTDDEQSRAATLLLSSEE